MKPAEFIDFQWTDYEGLPMEDRLQILETYVTKSKNLFESNGQLEVDRFNNLHRRAVSNPVSNKKYIMVLLALVNNEMRVFDNTQIVEYLSKTNDEYKVKLQDGRITTYPYKGLLKNLVISIFLFDSIENYDRFRVDVAMMFDRGLPDFKEEDL